MLARRGVEQPHEEGYMHTGIQRLRQQSVALTCGSCGTAPPMSLVALLSAAGASDAAAAVAVLAGATGCAAAAGCGAAAGSGAVTAVALHGGSGACPGPLGRSDPTAVVMPATSWSRWPGRSAARTSRSATSAATAAASTRPAVNGPRGWLPASANAMLL